MRQQNKLYDKDSRLQTPQQFIQSQHQLVIKLHAALHAHYTQSFMQTTRSHACTL